MRTSYAAITAMAALLAGCTMGPNYTRPQVAIPPSFRAPDPLPAQQAALAGGSTQAISGDFTFMSRPSTWRLSSSHAASVGHPGSPGRTRLAGRADAEAPGVGAAPTPPTPAKNEVAARPASTSRRLIFVCPLVDRSKIVNRRDTARPLTRRSCRFLRVT